MASRLDYEVPRVRFPGAQEDLEALLETLHRTGVLRALNGFFGRIDSVADVALAETNTPEGRNILGALLFVGQALAKVPVDDVKRVSAGLTRGVSRAREVIEHEPPSTFSLLRLLNDPETRRALAAVLMLLETVGAELAPEPVHDGHGHSHNGHRRSAKK